MKTTIISKGWFWLVGIMLVFNLYAAAGTETVTRTYDTSQLTSTEVEGGDGNTYTKIYWKGMNKSTEVGSPELPVEYIRFLVPVYSKNFKATVKNVVYAPEKSYTHKIFPVQMEVPSNGIDSISFTPPVMSAYSATPDIRATVLGDYFIDGCIHVVSVAISLGTYYDNWKSIVPASSLTVELNYDSCTAEEIPYILTPAYRSRYIDLSSIVVNADKENNQSYVKVTQKSAQAPNYVIITSASLKDSFEDLATWKRERGFNVILKTVESIYEEFPINETTAVKDSAASVREYLKSMFVNREAFFCLLAGDEKTTVPIRCARKDWSKTDAYSGNPYGENFIPTDNYFADLNSNFELRKTANTQVYAYKKDGYSFNPTIYVGRLLCHSPKEVKNYLDKLYIYEANPGLGDSDYLKNEFLLVHRQMASDVKDYLSELSVLNDTTFFWDASMSSAVDPSQNAASAIKQMAKSGLSSWQTHGCPLGVIAQDRNSGKSDITSLDIVSGSYKKDTLSGYIPWDKQGVLEEDNNGLDCLNNPYKPGIVYSMSCTNMPYGGYGYGNGFYYTIHANLGQAYTTYGKYGGIAFLGNTREGYIGTSTILETRFYFHIRHIPFLGVGEALSKAEFYYPGYCSTHVCQTHNLLGDPSVAMWMDIPNNFNIGESVSEDALTITNSSLKDAEVAVTYGMKITPNVSTISDASGYTYKIPENDFCLSVKKKDYLPILRVYAYKGAISNVKKRYIVRDAKLGCKEKSSWKYTIGENSELKITALDAINIYDGFVIEKGGKADLETYHSIEIDGASVKNGGNLEMNAKNVKITGAFKIEKGAAMSLNK